MEVSKLGANDEPALIANTRNYSDPEALKKLGLDKITKAVMIYSKLYIETNDAVFLINGG
jgi:hypothetical protein